MNKFLTGIKNVLTGLFYEHGKFSLGRLTFLILFSFSLFTWGRGNDIPTTAQTFLAINMSYVFGSKIVGIAEKFVSKK